MLIDILIGDISSSSFCLLLIHKRMSTSAIQDLANFHSFNSAIRFLDALERSQKVYCLFSHGSYNPIHNDHIRMMQHARDFILKTEPAAVVIGFFAYTSQSWMIHGKNMHASERFSDEDRKNMLLLAIEPFSWLFFAEDGPRFSSTYEVKMEYLAKFNRETEGIEVIGSDTAGSFGIKKVNQHRIVVMRDEASGKAGKELQNHTQQKIVGSGERNSDKDLEKRVWNESNESMSNQCEFDFEKNLILKGTCGHSSTKVRRALVDFCKQSNDGAYKYLQKAIHPKVLEYIILNKDTVMNGALCCVKD